MILRNIILKACSLDCCISTTGPSARPAARCPPLNISSEDLSLILELLFPLSLFVCLLTSLRSFELASVSSTAFTAPLKLSFCAL